MAKTDQHSELKAKLIAAFVSLECLFFFVSVGKPERQPLQKISCTHVPTARPSIEPPTRPLDPNQEFRAIPGRWVEVDFGHHSYGPYRFADGRRITLTLKNGEYYYDLGKNGRGWFSIKDIYYVDVTGDQIPDAIVNLGHVECGYGSCDGGADLFFIYSINAEGKMKELWQYETGSYGYGCGLKSLTLEGKEVRLELFGRCPPHVMLDIGPAKGMVSNLTQLVFRYTARGFIEDKMEFISTPVRDVKNYKAEVHIIE